MRVIAGSSGGIRLGVPKSVTRPTSDRVRESVFSILGDRVVGARVLDLFAGSGALGIEALSRGAREAVFVELNRAAASVVKENLARTGLGPASVISADALAFLRRPARQFDLVFADPPYLKRRQDKDFGAELLGAAGLPRAIRPAGVFVLESSAATDHGSPPGWRVADRRDYGGTALWFFEPEPGDNG